MWNSQNASHIHTASTAATGLNQMPNQDSTNNLPDFQCCWKVRKKLDYRNHVYLPRADFIFRSSISLSMHI